MTNTVPSNVPEKDREIPTYRAKPSRPEVDLGREPIMWQDGDDWVFALPYDWPADEPDPLRLLVSGGTGQWVWRGDKTLDGQVLRCCGSAWTLQHDGFSGHATAQVDAEQVRSVLRGFA